jgi:hypothetical protein
LTGPRFADAFRTDESPDVTDHDFAITCTCGLDQRLDTMALDDLGGLTLYDCSRCENTIVAILTDEVARQLKLTSGLMARRLDASGTRRNGHVVGSRVDLALRPGEAADDELVVYASAEFFDVLRYV